MLIMRDILGFGSDDEVSITSTKCKLQLLQKRYEDLG